MQLRGWGWSQRPYWEASSTGAQVVGQWPLRKWVLFPRCQLELQPGPVLWGGRWALVWWALRAFPHQPLSEPQHLVKNGAGGWGTACPGLCELPPVSACRWTGWGGVPCSCWRTLSPVCTFTKPSREDFWGSPRWGGAQPNRLVSWAGQWATAPSCLKHGLTQHLSHEKADRERGEM